MSASTSASGPEITVQQAGLSPFIFSLTVTATGSSKVSRFDNPALVVKYKRPTGDH